MAFQGLLHVMDVYKMYFEQRLVFMAQKKKIMKPGHFKS